MQKDFKRPLRPQQKSAYDGAKFFFKYFISLAMLYGLVVYFYFQKDWTQFSLLSLLHIVIMLVSYAYSLKFYSICNKVGNEPYQIRTKSCLNLDISEEDVETHFQDPNKLIRIQDASFEQQSKYHKHNSMNIDQKPVSPSTASINYCQSSNLMNEEDAEDKDKLHRQDHNSSRPKKYYCQPCQFECPYRARHCQKCQTCVLRYDHHCFWIGNCVGIRNHYYFYIFLLLQSINNFETTRMCVQIMHLQNLEYGFLWYSFLGLLFTGISFLLFTGYLFIYHSMLAFTGMTTWEHMRRQKISYMKHLKKGYQPFSDGPWKNFKDFIRRQWIDQKYYGRNGRQWQVPSFEEAKILQGGNLIENKYYSCC